MNGENTSATTTLRERTRHIFYAAAVLLIIIMIFYGLVKAKGFLAPLVTAIILSLVVLPLARKMEKVMSRLFSSILNALLLFIISLACLYLVFLQFQSLANDWQKIKDRMQPKIEQAQQYLVKNTPLSQQDVNFSIGDSNQTAQGNQAAQGIQAGQATQGNQASPSSGVSPSSATSAIQQAFSFLGKLSGYIGTYLLVFIYVFFLLFYRRRFRVFFLRVFPQERKEEVRNVISKTAKIAPKYLYGKLILMGIIAVIYAIGLGISGVNNFIIISLISALLALIPYIGNIIAYILAMAFGFLTSGDTSVLLGVTLTFGLGQFFQTYFLEPYILGDQVDVHPFFVILAVIIGNMVWGVVGMVLAIPLLGIVTIIFIHIRELHEIGLLFSGERLEPE